MQYELKELIERVRKRTYQKEQWVKKWEKIDGSVWENQKIILLFPNCNNPRKILMILDDKMEYIHRKKEQTLIEKEKDWKQEKA